MIHKNSIAGSALLDIKEDSLIIGAGAMSIGIDKQHGNFVQGPISFSSPFTRMRFGVIYKLNPMQMLGIPSTMITPIPTFNIEPPMKEVASMTALTSMILSTVA